MIASVENFLLKSSVRLDTSEDGICTGEALLREETHSIHWKSHLYKPIKFYKCARTQFYFTPCTYSKAGTNKHLLYLFKILQKYIDLPAVPQEVRSLPVVFALS